MADIERTVPYVPAVILKKGTCCTAPIVGPLPPDGYIPCDDLEPGCGGEGPAFELHVENPIHGDGTEETPVGLTLDPDETNTLEIREGGLYNPPGGGCQPGPGPYVAVWTVDVEPDGAFEGDTSLYFPIPLVDLMNADPGDFPFKVVNFRRAIMPGEPEADWMDIRQAQGDAGPYQIPVPPGGYSEVGILGPNGPNPDTGYLYGMVKESDPALKSGWRSVYGGMAPVMSVMDVGVWGGYIPPGVSDLTHTFSIIQKWFPCGSGVTDEPIPQPPAGLPTIFPTVPVAA